MLISKWIHVHVYRVVIEHRVLKFWSEIILVISNKTRAANSFDFEITHDFKPNFGLLTQICFVSLTQLISGNPNSKISTQNTSIRGHHKIKSLFTLQLKLAYSPLFEEKYFPHTII